MEWIVNPEAWVALATLTLLEIVLGIDNIIFISILVGRLPTRQRERARRIGIGLAMLSRIGLLLVISWVMGLQADLTMAFRGATSFCFLVVCS
jgi:predicted tellurium resistance membrane protein TerC